MALQLTVPDMACSACSDAITRAIHAVDPDATVQADSKTKIVIVETKVAEGAIREAIATAGYNAN